MPVLFLNVSLHKKPTNSCLSICHILLMSAVNLIKQLISNDCEMLQFEKAFNNLCIETMNYGKKLEEEGHICIDAQCINDKPEVIWCGKNPCSFLSPDCVDERKGIGSIMFRQKFRIFGLIKQQEIEIKLKKQGHDCVRWQQSNPGTMFWCHKEPCKYIDGHPFRQNKGS